MAVKNVPWPVPGEWWRVWEASHWEHDFWRSRKIQRSSKSSPLKRCLDTDDFIFWSAFWPEFRPDQSELRIRKAPVIRGSRMHPIFWTVLLAVVALVICVSAKLIRAGLIGDLKLLGRTWTLSPTVREDQEDQEDSKCALGNCKLRLSRLMNECAWP